MLTSASLPPEPILPPAVFIPLASRSLLIHPANNVLSTWCVPGTIVGVGDPTGNKKAFPQEADILKGRWTMIR